MLKLIPPQIENLVQPEPTLKLISKLDEVFQRRLNAMKPKYRKWQLNLAFEEGLQWHTFDQSKGRIVDLRPSRQKQVRVVFNLIGPFVRSTISMLSQSNPTMDVIPASFSPKDEKAAKSAQVHLDRIDIINQKSVNDILLRKNITSFGTSFKLEYWNKVPDMEDLNEADPETIEDVKNMDKPVQPVPVKDETDAEKLMEREKRGECGEAICSPFEILLDYPLVRKGKDIRDFIKYGLVSLDYVRASWKAGKYVTSENVANYQVLGELFNNSNDFFAPMREENQVVLKEWFEGPSKDHPRGRHIQWAHGVLLHDGRLSHPKGKLGLFDYHWNISPSDFYGPSYVEPLIEPQIIVNRIFSKLTNWLNTNVRFRVAVPAAANFSKAKFSGNGDVYEYNNIGGTGALNMPIPDMPPAVFEFLFQVIANFKDIASRHEVSKGEIPGDRMSGRAIRSLQEADSQYLIPSMIVWEERERQVALFKLDLMREYYKTPRQAKILGEGRNVKIFNLQDTDLEAGIDINIVKGSSMPKSKVSQQSLILDLFQDKLLGNIDDPATHKKVLRWMDIGGMTAVYGSVEIGANLQQQEIMTMREGEPVPVQSYHDHYVHNQECLKELNMPGFPEEAPEFQAMMVRHWQEHGEFIKRMNMGIMPGQGEIDQGAAPMPGVGGKANFPESVNPQTKELKA